MKKLIGVFVFTVLLLFSWSGSGSSAVLYDNGPSTYNLQAWTVNFGYSVSDQFTLSSASTVTGANIYTWQFAGDTLSTVNWYITSGGTALNSPFSGMPGVTTWESGTASPTNTSLGTNSYGYNIWQDTFTIPSLSLAAGTYWLQIDTASVPSGNPVFWDINNGPSIAWESAYGNVNGNLFLGSNSDTFQILGGTAPEPCTMLLLGSGLIGLVAFRKKFRA